MPRRLSLKWRINAVFTAIVATILSVFALSIFVFSKETQMSVFYERLSERAKATADLILEKDELDSVSFRKVGDIFARSLPEEIVEVYDHQNHCIFNLPKDATRTGTEQLLEAIRRAGRLERVVENDQQIGINYRDNQGEFVILIRAHDASGLLKIERLKMLLRVSLLASIVVTISVGWLFSNHLLRPFTYVISKLNNITEHSLHTRLEMISEAAEIRGLIHNINGLLDRLEGSFRAQKVFIANVSHEIRTPLSIILGELEVASLEKNEAALQSHLESFRQEVIRLVRLSEQLLWLAHASRDRHEIYFSKIRIDEVVFEATHSKRIPARKVNINYAINPVDDTVLTLDGNADLLRALFINLIENAIKFSPDDNDVNVTIAATKDAINIMVKDQGPGIPMADQAAIFKPFYRTTGNAKSDGHGIGLYLCRQIADIHSADILVDSEMGKGTSITIRWPNRRANESPNLG